MKNFRLPLALLALTAAAFAADKPVLVPGASIELKGSTGKSDFLQVDAVNRRLLGAHEKDDTLDLFDLDTHKLIARVKLGGVVEALLDAKTGRYFVSVQDEKKVVVLDAKTFKEVGTAMFDGEIDAICLDPKHRRLYVGHDNGTHLWAIDLDTLKPAGEITIPGAPECMAYDAAAGRIYLAIKTTHQVVAIDTEKNAIVATWPLAPATGPHGVGFDAKAGRLFVAGDNGQLVALDVTTGKVVATAKITPTVDQLAYDPALRRIYCAGPDWMSVVEFKADGSLAPLGNVPTAATAKNVAVDPKTHAVWSTFTDGKNAFAKSWKQP